MSRRRHSRVVLVATVAGSLAVGPVPSVEPTAAAPASRPGGAVEESAEPGPVHRGEVLADDRGAVVAARPDPVWPTPGVASVDLRGPGTPRVGPSAAAPVVVRAADRVPATSHGGGPAPGRVRLELLDRSTVAGLGGIGVGFRITRADGVGAAGPVRVNVSYEGLRSATVHVPARARLTRLPACALSSPNRTECLRGAMLETTNDAATGVLSATATAGDGSIYVLTMAASSGAGNYKATDVKPSGSWVTGLASGGFSYTYPIPLPPSVGGSAPSLALSYSSQAVDGMSADANMQGSWVGTGWELDAGFIERRYVSCALDGSPQYSDLCWRSPYVGVPSAAAYVISINGRTSDLIRDGGGTYHLKEEPGWTVTRRTDSPGNGDVDGEWWEVWTPDGTRYWFGRGKKYEGYTGASAPATNSVLTVPVVSDDPNEPGYSTGPILRTKAYRWMLDRVADRNENVTAYTYSARTNFYKRINTGNIHPYERAGYLDSVEYGLTSGDTSTSIWPARVTFTTGSRCTQRMNDTEPANGIPGVCPTPIWSYPASYPDVPTDLMCTSTACDENSPTFFHTDRLEQIQVLTRQTGGAGHNENWKIWLRHEVLGTGNPMLWLDWVRRDGVGADDDELPMTDFGYGTLMNNRVDWNDSAGAPKLEAPRLKQILTDTGGRIYASYSDATDPDPLSCPFGGADSAGFQSWYNATNPNWDDNTELCYPTYYTPDGGGAGFGIFHKYVVRSVEVFDQVAGSPSMRTAYEYSPGSGIGAGWAHDGDWFKDSCDAYSGNDKTWSDFRGFRTVRVTTGTGPGDQRGVSTYAFYRGMDGDHDPGCPGGTESHTVTDYDGNSFIDHQWLAGMPLQVRRYDNGTGDELSSERYQYWWANAAADGPDFHDARLVRKDYVRTRTRTFFAATGNFGRGSPSGWREFVPYQATFDSTHGREQQVLDQGEVGVSDNTCRNISYAAPSGSLVALMVAFPSRVTVYSMPGSDCSAGTQIGRTDTLYDSATNPDNQALVDGNATETRTYKSSSTYVSTKAGYDDYGRVTSTTDGLGKITTVTYTPATHWPYTEVKTQNPAGHITRTTLSARFGAPTRVVDANGRITELDYDTAGRLLRVYSPLDPRSGTTPTTKYTYTPAGPGVVNAPPRIKTEQLQAGSTYLSSFVYFDGLGRVRETQTHSAAETGGRTVVATHYDDRGLVAKVTGPHFNSASAGTGLLGADVTTLDSYTAYTYDALGRQVTATIKSQSTPKFTTYSAYLGNRAQVAEPVVSSSPVKGFTATWDDAHGNTSRIDEWNNGVPSTTTYGYDPLDRLTSITDNLGNVTSYGYDWLGRRTSSDDPDAGPSTSEYDANGNLTKTTDALGHVVETAYDSINRPTRRDVTPAGGVKTQTAVWTYDTAGAGNFVGRLASQTTYSGGQPYVSAITGYDDKGRVLGQDIIIPNVYGVGGTYSTRYGYDKADRPTTFEYVGIAGGLGPEIVTTAYTAQGRPDRLTSNAFGNAVYVDNTTYTNIGQLDTRAYGPSGARVTRDYDWEADTGRLDKVKTSTTTNPSVQNDDYTYDPAGNIVSLFDGVSGVSQYQCFAYDDLQRLTRAWTTGSACNHTTPNPSSAGPDPYDHTYSYNSIGNVSQIVDHRLGQTRTYGYPAPGAGVDRPHAATSVTRSGTNPGTDSYGYNGTGAMTTRTVAGTAATLTWSPEQKLTSVTIGGTTSSFVYDASGNRLLRVTPTETVVYLDGQELRRAGSVTTATRYYTSGGTAVAMRTGATGTPLTWLLSDGQNSTQITIAASSLTPTRRRYLPYGGLRGTAALPPGTDRGWIGQNADPTTGLLSLGARYYDPALARFISTDPLSVPDSPQLLNAYSYSANNPITYSDPTGLCAHDNPECPDYDPPGSGGGGGGRGDPDMPDSDTRPPSADTGAHPDGGAGGGTSTCTTDATCQDRAEDRDGYINDCHSADTCGGYSVSQNPTGWEYDAAVRAVCEMPAWGSICRPDFVPEPGTNGYDEYQQRLAEWEQVVRATMLEIQKHPNWGRVTYGGEICVGALATCVGAGFSPPRSFVAEDDSIRYVQVRHGLEIETGGTIGVTLAPPPDPGFGIHHPTMTVCRNVFFCAGGNIIDRDPWIGFSTNGRGVNNDGPAVTYTWHF